MQLKPLFSALLFAAVVVACQGKDSELVQSENSPETHSDDVYEMELGKALGKKKHTPTPVPTITIVPNPTEEPTAEPTLTPSPSPSPTSAATASPSPTVVMTATPVPTTPAPTSTPSTGQLRPPVTTPVSNIAGWNATQYLPQNRTARIAVSSDGSRLGVIWQHNADHTDVFQGEPTAYASIGDLAMPSSFSAPTIVGKRTFEYSANATTERRQYNVRHNEGIILSDGKGGFVGLSLENNANGWSEGIDPTGFGYYIAECLAGTKQWSLPGLAKLGNVATGSSISELSGTGDIDGNLHIFGQSHLGGGNNGAFAYQRRAAGSEFWNMTLLGATYRINGLSYFGEGSGFVDPKRNAAGKFDIHAAFAWNKQGGEGEHYGLYYLKSEDSGLTWRNASGSSVVVPLKIGVNDAQGAIVPANLGTSSYSGSIKGPRGISVTADNQGKPIIVAPQYVSTTTAQNRVYIQSSGNWINVPVGPAVFWNFYATHVSYNSLSQKVNVVMLDPGSTYAPGRVLLYHQSLLDLLAGRTNWTQEILASVTNTRIYSSSLDVRVIPNKRFVILFEPSYANPGRVSPVIFEADMR